MKKCQKQNFAPFKMKCRRCGNKMRYSGNDLTSGVSRYTCDTCNYTVKITNDNNEF
jgi:transposase-like protein